MIHLQQNHIQDEIIGINKNHKGAYNMYLLKMDLSTFHKDVQGGLGNVKSFKVAFHSSSPICGT